MKGYSSKKNKNTTNIKIFTFFYTNNYSALFQALYLKEFLTTSSNSEEDKKPIPWIESLKFSYVITRKKIYNNFNFTIRKEIFFRTIFLTFYIIYFKY